MRALLSFLAFALVAAACATGQPAATPATVTTSGGPASAASAPGAAEPLIDGPAAPDFSLTLASGEAFSLSGEQRPVYMIFWAEW